MIQYVFFLGSHAPLSAAEAVAALHRHGLSPTVTVAQPQLLLVAVSQELPDNFLTYLGGTTRIARLLGTQKQPWSEADILPLLSLQSQQKIRLGISSIGMSDFSARELGLALKRRLRGSGVRAQFIVPNKGGQQLNAAQVFFNDLCHQPNSELTFISHDGRYLVARTEQIQDIQRYELRDTLRPERDLKIGLLPPKLAQIMLNVTGLTKEVPTVFDPFCGVGTVLQEGWLAGYAMSGSDKNQAMVQAATHNLTWLSEHFSVSETLHPRIFHHDVTNPFPPEYAGTFDAIVTEPYLGEPLRSPLPQQQLTARIKELGALYLDFFRNAAPTLTENGRMCFILPAFRHSRRSREFWLFPDAFLAEIASLGYQRLPVIPDELSAWYAADDRITTLYAREDALVGRELTLWQKA